MILLVVFRYFGLIVVNQKTPMMQGKDTTWPNFTLALPGEEFVLCVGLLAWGRRKGNIIVTNYRVLFDFYSQGVIFIVWLMVGTYTD